MREVSESLLRTHLAERPSAAGPPRVVASGNGAVPWALLDVVDSALESYALFMLNAPVGIPDRAGVVLESPFVGPGMRGRAGLRYLPSRLSQVPQLFRSTCPPDVVLLHTTPESDGRVSLGVEVNILPAAVEAAKERGALVLAQTNPRVPWTFGDAELDVDLIDAVLPVETALTVPRQGHGHGHGPLPDEVVALGKVVAGRVPDGATLQLGIGLVPDAVLPGLLHLRGLGVWSEMLSDGVLALQAAGALDPERTLVASFMVGSDTLYAWADRNEQVLMRRTEVTNDPAKVAEQQLMVSINTALQVDLFAQANATRVAGRIHSGLGGQSDFVVGALHAPGGQALMALRSWHPRADVSTIVPLLEEPATSFQHTAVITEQGVATIWGNDERTQAGELIENAAHPSVRQELWEEATALGLA